ncbi:MAG TPA: AzlC family ABC transporter permease [Acidimicrobiales bacterium]|nr:AzlC family ABC transporter permease [Acidimicrobiales bacterium]
MIDDAPLAPDLRRNAIVLGAAVGVFGVSFGVLATTAGLTAAQACAMSVLVFTGASQFAAVGVVATGGSLASAFGSALLLAARNAAYGVAMAPTFRDRPLSRRLLAAQVVIDETTAMATAQTGRRARIEAFWVTGIAVFTFWNVGTVLGALAGDAIGDPEAWGLDAAFPAGYVALAVPHLRTRQGRIAAVAGVAISLTLVPLAPAGVPIVAAALGVVPAVLFGSRPPVGTESGTEREEGEAA